MIDHAFHITVDDAIELLRLKNAAALARKLKVSRAAVTRWRTGGVPPKQILVILTLRPRE